MPRLSTVQRAILSPKTMLRAIFSHKVSKLRPYFPFFLSYIIWSKLSLLSIFSIESSYDFFDFQFFSNILNDKFIFIFLKENDYNQV